MDCEAEDTINIPKRGLIVLDEWISFERLCRQFVCRRCHRGIGRPWFDELTGEFDHSRITCHGDDLHEIVREGDVEPKGQVEHLNAKREIDGLEVAIRYRMTGETPEQSSKALYGDPDFEGFG